MDLLKIIIQLGVAFAIVNVWVFRKDRSSPWRGGNADDLEEEFQEYGLPRWMLIATGLLKLSCAALLVVGVWVPLLAKLAAAGLAVLMLGAVFMHFKVRDPARKSVPAASLLALAAAVLVL